MYIKKLFPIVTVFVMLILPQKVYSQFYELANSLQTTLGPALSGAGNYKGYVDAGYSHTLGHYNGDFLEVSTSQGYKYKSWFYVGAGLGIDILWAHKGKNWGMDITPPPGFEEGKKSTDVGVMLPLFTDFRFDIGNSKSPMAATFFLDLRVGCSFLLSNKYIEIGEGYLTNQEYFFLRPSLGVRIPLSSKHPKQALDIALNYKLLTSNYWTRYNNNITLQALGASVGFEW